MASESTTVTDDSSGPAGDTAGEGAPVLVCPRCRATLPERFVRRDKRRAVCPSCEHRFAIDTQLVAPRRVSTGRRRRIAPPAGVSSDSSAAGLTLTWHWPRWRATAPLIFLVFFGGLLTFYSVLPWKTTTVELIIVLTMFACATLFLLWIFLAYRLNRTVVTIRDGQLCVSHGPIPWPGRRDLPAQTIRQLYSAMYHDHALRRGDGYTSYRLRAVLANGAELLLVHNLTAPEQALYFEQEIERYLEIEDQPVPGELPR